MSIIRAYPPNYAAIREIFPSAAFPGVVFAYAPDIYSPTADKLHPAIIAHEMVHIKRQQAQGVESWWIQYLVDAEFRYNEELLAHRAEYQFLIAGNSNRNNRRSALKIVAKRLASKIYGKVRTEAQAMADILEVSRHG